MMRIGHGFDVHRFGEGDHVMLGGVRIPHSAGLIAHSDGDVVLHALCDALLGAIGEGDIGRHFPDTDARYKDADSRELLVASYNLVRDKGYVLGNADITILAQQPRIAPHVEHMREAICRSLDVDFNSVNVKATTTEELGYIGRKEGIGCHAVVLLSTYGGDS